MSEGRTGARTESTRSAARRARRAAEAPAAGVPGASGGPGRAATTYRGVRWQRNTAGRIRWHNDESDRWVLWKPGQDAPPRPPGWGDAGAGPAGTPLRDRRARKGWRSPYRLVPVALAALVLILGIVQATRGQGSGPDPVAVEKAAAEQLLDRCLVAHGSAGGQPRIASQPVPCGSPQASVKVVKVLSGTPGSPSCPAGTSTVRLDYPGVPHPHQLCVQHLGS